MKSIAKAAIIRKSPSVEALPHAIRVRGSGQYRIGVVNLDNLRGQGKADGKIRRLSANSLMRLRSAIASTVHNDGDYTVYGSCLTIPWGNSKDGNAPTQEQGAEIWHRYTHNIGRLLDKLHIGIIYRVELQERGAPHWHLMTYIPNSLDERIALQSYTNRCKCFPSDIPHLGLISSNVKRSGKPMIDVLPSLLSHQWAHQALRALWISTLFAYHRELIADRDWSALAAPIASGADPSRSNIADIKTWSYCYDAIRLDGVASGIAYLASHTTKHKQEQLGWIGKQWGYLGRSWLREVKALPVGDGFPVDDIVRIRAFRSIRLWCKRNRFRSDWRIVRPRRLSIDGFFVHKGLVVTNQRQIYLFGVPRDLFELAFLFYRSDLSVKTA